MKECKRDREGTGHVTTLRENLSPHLLSDLSRIIKTCRHLLSSPPKTPAALCVTSLSNPHANFSRLQSSRGEMNADRNEVRLL